MTAWLNGKLVDTPIIDATDRGFTLGDGLFETIRVAGGTPRWLDRHLARLTIGCEVLGFPPPDQAAIRGGITALLDALGLHDGVLRLTLTRGPAPRGVIPPRDPRPTLLITAGASPLAQAPARVIVARKTRRNEQSPLSRVKSLNYLDSILARLEAEEAGADEALLLNTQSNLAEATAANVFLVLNGDLVTPRISDGALPGVARALLIDAGMAREGAISESAFAQATSGFLANALGIRAIRAIDGRPLSDDSKTIAQAEQVTADAAGWSESGVAGSRPPPG
jgi:branched-chain amino acid aminotransferase